jgi:hypothetical protein
MPAQQSPGHALHLAKSPAAVCRHRALRQSCLGTQVRSHPALLRLQQFEAEMMRVVKPDAVIATEHFAYRRLGTSLNFASIVICSQMAQATAR